MAFHYVFINLLFIIFFNHLSTMADDTDIPKASVKISRGSESPPRPFQVQIIIKPPFSKPIFMCSGTIIHERWILTVAHCAKELESEITDILAGSSRLYDYAGGKTYQMDFSVIHKDFKKDPIDKSLQNDIAMLHLSRKIELDNEIHIAKIGRGRYHQGDVLPISGWGATEKHSESREMLATELKLIGFEECRRRWKHLQNSQICAVPKIFNSAPCTGDSGSPLFVINRDNIPLIIAMESYGQKGDCPDTRSPDVFTLVYPYADWIRKVIHLYP